MIDYSAPGQKPTQTESEVSTMRRNYEVFEKFPDGSTLWRTCVAGRYEAQRKIQELREHSENDFVSLDIHAQRFVPTQRGQRVSNTLELS